MYGVPQFEKEPDRKSVASQFTSKYTKLLRSLWRTVKMWVHFGTVFGGGAWYS